MERELNITNINAELAEIENQIDIFTNLKHHYTHCYTGIGDSVTLAGLEEEDFNKVKNQIIRMLKEAYNKKLDKLIAFCEAKRFKGE